MSSRSRWINSFSKRSALALAAASASAGLVNSAFGASGTWTFNGNNSWDFAAAWNITNTPADGVGANANFGGGFDPNASNVVTLTTNHTIGSLLFADSDPVNTGAGWRMDGSSILTLNSGIPGISPIITVNALGTGVGTNAASAINSVVHISTPFAGTQGFAKQGVGTLFVAGSNTGLSGSIVLQQGALMTTNANAFGTSGSVFISSTGTGLLGLRNDTGTNFGINLLTLNSDAVLGVGNNYLSSGAFGSGQNQTHTIGNVNVGTYGNYTLTVSGSNGYGLTMGKLSVYQGMTINNVGAVGTLGADLNQNNVNGQGSGLLTIGTVDLTDTVARTVTFGGSGSMAGNITVTNNLTQTGGGTMSLVYTGDKTLSIGSLGITGNVSNTGNGTITIGSGALPSGKNLTIAGGTVLLNGASQTHSINTLTMGGASISSGNVFANLTAQGGSSTISLGDNVTVNSSLHTDGTVANLVGTINAKVNMGGTARTFTVNGGSTGLTITGAVTNGTGIVKSGSGTLAFQSANVFGGNITVNDGTFEGKVQSVGSPFEGSGGAAASVTTGGALRLDSGASAGTGTITNLTFTDSGTNTGLVVDDGGGTNTTLRINGTVSRTNHATINIVPGQGHLGTTENFSFASAPGTQVTLNNGSNVLPGYWAVQNSGSDTRLNFASLAVNNPGVFTGFSSATDINSANSGDIFHATSSTTNGLTANRTVFGLQVDAGQTVNVGAANTLKIGSAGNVTALILNGGAAITSGNLTFGNTNEEGVIWSGGTTRNTITSAVALTGDLTTGGAQALQLTTALGLGNASRNITVSGGTLSFTGGVTVGGGSAAIVKNGGGVLVIDGASPGLAGSNTTTVNYGTLQLGNNTLTGDLGSSAISVATGANLAIRRSNTASPAQIQSAISGGGNLIIDGGGTSSVQLNGLLTYGGNTTINSGILKAVTSRPLPSSTNLFIAGGATLDMNGVAQSVNSLSGGGTISDTVAGTHDISVTSGTFSGNLRNNGGSLTLTKTGPGLLVLSGGSSTYKVLNVNGGTVQVDNGGALPARASLTSNDATIALNNAALVLNNSTNRTITGALAVSGVSTLSLTMTPAINITASRNGWGAAITGGNLAGWTGGGTLVLDLNGRQIDMGDNNTANPGSGQTSAQFTLFTGTLKFSDSNPDGSWFRWAGGVNNFVTGTNTATFDFGSGINMMSLQNGTVTVRMGYVAGGTNTILSGNDNTGGRITTYAMGNFMGPGATPVTTFQTFSGILQDYTSPASTNIGSVALQKVGTSSTLTLTNVQTYGATTTVANGTLILGSGSDIQGSPTINVGAILTPGTLAGGNNIFNGMQDLGPSLVTQAATLQFGGGTISNATIINLSASNSTFPVSANLVVPNGFTTPTRVTFAGGGTVYGNLNHTSGALNPGSLTGFGTLTFANNLTVNGGNLNFEVSSGSVNVVGSGTNDLLRVLPASGLTLTSGVARLNFLGQTSNLQIGDYYPLMTYSGTIGGDPANIQTTALFHGTFHLGVGTAPGLENTIGAYVDNPTGASVNLTWAPTNPTAEWDNVVTKNWKQTGGPATPLFFFDTDTVTFDDSTTFRTVSLPAGTLRPGAIIVSTANTYNFTGTGVISGTTSLTKNGGGTLIISNNSSNTFTGGVTVNGGTLVASAPSGNVYNGLGIATIALNNNANLAVLTNSPNANSAPNQGSLWVNGNNTLIMDVNTHTQDYGWDLRGSGTLTISKPAHVAGGANPLLWLGPMTSFLGTIVIPARTDALQFQLSNDAAGSTTGNFGGPSVTFDLGNSGSTLSLGTSQRTFDIGALKGNGYVVGQEYDNSATYTAVTANNTATISVGAKNVDFTFDGQVRDGAGALTHVIKTGALSTWTITNTQPSLGNVFINQGTVALSNGGVDVTSIYSSPTIIIAQGAKLDVTNLFGAHDGSSGMSVIANQRFTSNGDVVGGEIHGLSGSVVSGTNYSGAIFMDQGATLSPGATGITSVGTMAVGALDTTSNGIVFRLEGNTTGLDRIDITNPDSLNTGVFNPIELFNLGGLTSGQHTILTYNSSSDLGLDSPGVFLLPTDFVYGVSITSEYDSGTGNGTVSLIFAANSGVWNVANGGLWATGTNWTGGLVPTVATLGNAITNNATITLSPTGQGANSITFDSPKSYTLVGGTLTFDQAGVSPSVTVLQGNHSILAPTKVLNNLTVNIASTSTLSWLGTVTNTNIPGTVNTLTKAGSGTVIFSRLNMNTASLTVTGGKVIMSTKPVANQVDGTSLVAGFTIASGASVDLANNALVVDLAANASAPDLDNVRTHIQSNRLISSAVGGAIRLGFRTNQALATPTALGMGSLSTFSGVAVDSTSILVKTTYGGDTNLDGQVDLNDIYNLAQSWLSTSGEWQNGDFNYDGTVNASDLTILAHNWQAGVGSPLPGMDLVNTLGLFGLPASAVPEPSSLALAGVGALGLLSRRRRRS
ncbi:MAG TPA: autotransporter-associated beta strand repeat-containing protein [Tepidisphaeraceae bacterium]|nr:autotransporter-associated beta strand repeat-containing protein [Tepidisphaeraceae bacterium]